MRTLTFAKSTGKEILRDPLTMSFGLGFPLVLILLLTLIQKNIPVSMFELESLTPGITVFGLSFMTLFSALLIAKDRETAFLQRLYATPLTASGFIFGYTLPILPLSAAQSLICYIVAAILGMKITANILIALLLVIPLSLLYVSMGLLFGSVLSSKQVGGICGALLTNLSAWFSGIWFDLNLIGGVFKKIAYCLPFVHAVEMEKAAFAGNFGEILPHFLWVAAYTIATSILAIILFLRQMRKQ